MNPDLHKKFINVIGETLGKHDADHVQILDNLGMDDDCSQIFSFYYKGNNKNVLTDEFQKKLQRAVIPLGPWYVECKEHCSGATRTNYIIVSIKNVRQLIEEEDKIMAEANRKAMLIRKKIDSVIEYGVDSKLGLADIAAKMRKKISEVRDSQNEFEELFKYSTQK